MVTSDHANENGVLHPPVTHLCRCANMLPGKHDPSSDTWNTVRSLPRTHVLGDAPWVARQCHSAADRTSVPTGPTDSDLAWTF